MHIVTKKMALMLAVLTIATSCNLSAAECKKQITRHLHYSGPFPKPGLFLALQALILRPAQEKPAPKFDEQFFHDNVTNGVLDLPLLLEKEQS